MYDGRLLLARAAIIDFTKMRSVVRPEEQRPSYLFAGSQQGLSNFGQAAIIHAISRAEKRTTARTNTSKRYQLGVAPTALLLCISFQKLGIKHVKINVSVKSARKLGMETYLFKCEGNFC